MSSKVGFDALEVVRLLFVVMSYRSLLGDVRHRARITLAVPVVPLKQSLAPVPPGVYQPIQGSAQAVLTAVY